jgi:threonine dehydratase
MTLLLHRTITLRGRCANPFNEAVANMVHEEMAWIAGIDGCKGGWIVVSHPIGDRGAAQIGVFKTFSEVCAHLPRRTLIGIDMPIGLPNAVEAGGRAPDRAARAIVGPRRSSVFAVPSRAAVYAFAGGYREVCAVARQTSSPPWSPSKQAFWIFPRIQDIDLALQADKELAGRVFEIHPEVSFRMMKDAPLEVPKKVKGRCHADGMNLRKDLLKAQGFSCDLVDQAAPRGAGLDDLLDACAVAWSAARISRREAMVFPDPPGFDDMGLRVAIWA